MEKISKIVYNGTVCEVKDTAAWQELEKTVQSINVNSQTYTPTNGALTLPDYPSGNVTGSDLTANNIVIGNGNSSIKTSDKTIVTSISDVDTSIPTSKAVTIYVTEQIETAINNLPNPMVFKGTLGNNGTISSLPSATTENEGDTYKVITAGTYASKTAKIGDVFVSNGDEWILIPAGDDVEDTWREVKVNGNQILDNSISSGLIDFVKGENISLDYDSNTHKLTITAINTARASNTETIKSVSEWSAGTNPTLGTPISADDITSWNEGALPTATVSEGVLRFTQGALPNLEYESKSIPNVTSVGTTPSLTTTDIEVVTEVSI